jgi:hypothetical protein
MSAVTTFDADATALKTRILLPSMNLETTTERRVRERVRDALREEFGDDEAEVDAAIVSREIDAFLRTIPADAGAESAQQEEEDQRVEKRARDASANEPMSPTLLKRARAVHDVLPPGSPATAVSEDKLLSAVRALGEEGGDAKEIASFLKKDKSAVNKVLYALMKRGTVTQEVSAGNGGRPRWFIADNAGTMATVASSQATTVSARAATSSMPVNSVGGGGSVGGAASAQPGSSTVTAAPLDGVVPVQDEVIALSATKRVTVRKWNGNTLIDIREYYQPGGEGEYRPGKKGISLNVSQWSALKSVIDGAHDAFEQCESTGQEVVLGELSPMRRAVVSKYMGKIFLNIREYYEKNGVKLPGQKGVTLTKDLCERLVANKDQVSDRIASM